MSDLLSHHWLRVRQPTDEQMAQEYASERRATGLTLFQLAGAEFLASIVFSGALERYPGMKFVLGECGASWIPTSWGVWTTSTRPVPASQLLTQTQ